MPSPADLLHALPSSSPDLKIGQFVLTFVSTTKILGVRLQNDLKWDTQGNYMNKNAVKRLFMLLSLKRFRFNKSGLVTVYTGYIRPLIEYSDVIWHSRLTSNQTHQLEKFKKGLWELFLVLIMFHMQIPWMCVMLTEYLPRGSNIVSLRNPFPSAAGLISCSLCAEARYIVGNWGQRQTHPAPCSHYK